VQLPVGRRREVVPLLEGTRCCGGGWVEVEGAGGEVVVGEAGAGLDDADPVALLGQPQRGDRAAESRADDQDVEVEAVVVARGVGAVGGVGGGGIFVPLLNLVLGFDTKSAAALSKCKPHPSSCEPAHAEVDRFS
jgi:hypothetical protein